MKQFGSRESSIFLPSLTQLRAFAAVARLESISRASKELRRSQSAVTQAIQNLETELGVTLFTRTSTGSYLTDMGRILHQRTEACFSRMCAAVKDISDGGTQDPAHSSTLSRRVTRAQILALTAVNEHGSFAQAARHVQVSLTSLHRSARSLEKQIGRKLFVNTAQGVATNKLGSRLSRNLLLAVRELEWAEEEIKSQKGVLRGRLLIGSLLLAGNQLITVVLEQFIAANPEVRISMVSGAYDELLSRLRGGSVDFVVGLLKNPPPADDVAEETLGLDHYTVAVSRYHPLVGREQITLADLEASEWIVARPSAQRRKVFEALFKNRPLPRHNIETHSLPTIIALLAQSNRMAILTRSELALDRQLGSQLTCLNYTVGQPPAAIGVTTRKQWEPTLLQKTFLNFLRSQTVGSAGLVPETKVAEILPYLFGRGATASNQNRPGHGASQKQMAPDVNGL